MRLLTVTLTIGLFLGQFNLIPASGQKVPPFVSMLSLMSDPPAFSGRVLSISGWLYVQVEDDRAVRAWLFPSPDHVRAHDFPSSMPIDFQTLKQAWKGSAGQLAQMHGAYVILEGEFKGSNLKAPGNLGIGELQEITKVENPNASQ